MLTGFTSICAAGTFLEVARYLDVISISSLKRFETEGKEYDWAVSLREKVH
jgi:hypothetical protein